LDDRGPFLTLLRHIAATRRQNLCILQDNLLEGSRKETLKLFKNFRKRAVVQLETVEVDADSINPNFTKYTLPTEEEGFDEVIYKDSIEAEKTKLSTYIANRKLAERLNPVPGREFRHVWDTFSNDVQVWKKQQQGLDLAEVDEFAESIDIFNVNVFNGGPGGKPIFAFFAEEDWLLLEIRFQLALLVKSFCQDCDRQGFHARHFTHYYAKYFNKLFKPQDINHDSIETVIQSFVPEVCVKKNMVSLTEDSSKEKTLDALYVLRLIEDRRQDRMFRVETGDEMAQVTFDSLKERKKANEEERQKYERSRERRRRYSRSRSRRRETRHDRSRPRAASRRYNS